MATRQYSGKVQEVPVEGAGFSVFRIANMREVAADGQLIPEPAEHSGGSNERTAATCTVNGSVTKDSWVLLTGYWHRHPTHGWQFKVTRLRSTMPQDSEAIRSYLSMGEIEGIGPELAARLVNRFGDQTLDVMENSPTSLTAVHGIGAQRAQIIAQHVREKRLSSQVSASLSKLGLPDRVVNDLNQKYGDYAHHRLTRNPFELLCGPPFFDFGLAIHVADQVEHSNSRQALSGLLMDAFHHVQDRDGAFCLAVRDIRSYVGKVYPESLNLLDALVNGAPDPFRALVDRDGGVFLIIGSNARNIEAIEGLIGQTPHGDSRIAGAMAYAESNAVSGAFRVLPSRFLRGRVSVIDGSLGTQGMHFIEQILAGLLGMDPALNVRLFCRTSTMLGRLRKRFNQPVKTLSAAKGNQPGFELAEEERIDLVVIFESEQLSLRELATIAKGVGPRASVLLVGDRLAKAFGSAIIYPHVLASLTRQHGALQLDQACYAAWHNHFHGAIHADPQASLYSESDSFRAVQSVVVSRDDKVVPTVVDEVAHFSESIGLESVHVLTPDYRGRHGSDALNRALEPLCPAHDNQQEVPYLGERILQVGDRLAAARPLPMTSWKSGDVGEVRHIDRERNVITVQLRSGISVDIGYPNLSRLSLAWATTVRSTPAQTFSVVVMLVSESTRAVTWQDFYTALGWADHRFILVGTRSAIATLLSGKPPAPQYSVLDHLRTLAPWIA